MSKSSYTFTTTRMARLAQQDIREATAEVRAFSYTRAEIALMAAPTVQRDFSLTTWELQQQDWQLMHRGAVASVGQRQYRAVCYPLPVPVKYIRQGHRAAVNVLYLG